MEPDDKVFDETHAFLDETGRDIRAVKPGVPYRTT